MSAPTLHELLCQAAGPAPAPAPDSDLRRRARRQRRDVYAVRAAAALSAVAACAALLSPAARPAEVRTVGPASDAQAPGAGAGAEGPDDDPGGTPAPARAGAHGARLEDPAPPALPGAPTTLPPALRPGRAEPKDYPPPPQGERLYFESAGEIVSAALDGSDRRAVASASDGMRVAGAWPGGRRLLVVRSKGGARLSSLDVDTGAVRDLLRLPQDRLFSGVALSADGSRIAYSSYSSAVGGQTRYGLHVMNSDGTGDALVLAEGDPADWSPDGGRILAKRCRQGAGQEELRVCTVRPDGTGLTEMEHLEAMWGWGIRWSPDGRWIAGKADGDRLGVVPADGGRARLVGGRLAGTLSWTADGSRLVYERSGDGNYDALGRCDGECGYLGIWSVAFDGTGLSAVADGPGDFNPVVARP